MNASPDLRTQIEATAELLPIEGRQSPVRNVILTGGDVDQVWGLLLLREFHFFKVYATASIRRILTEHNVLFNVLSRYSRQIQWIDVETESSVSFGDALAKFVSLAHQFPSYVPASLRDQQDCKEPNVGLLISTGSDGGVAFLPNCAVIPDRLLERLQRCDVVLFDGTFWSEDEPEKISGLERGASAIGHIPISGAGGSIERLAGLTRPKKYFIHVNHTNPILDEESAEHAQIRKAGWEIAHDGMEIQL